MTAAGFLVPTHARADVMGAVLVRIFATQPRWSPTVMRVALGTVMAAHGAQNLLGWFGGYGIDGTMKFFVETIGMPAPLAALVIALESFGALALVAGFATRPIAIGLAAVLVGAIVTVHAPFGFFMDWFGQQDGEGIEFFLLGLALCVALAIDGGGRLSVDHLAVGSPEDRRDASGRRIW